MGNKGGIPEEMLAPGTECLLRWQQKWRLGIVRSIDRRGNVTVEIRVRHKNMLIDVPNAAIRRRLAPRGSHYADPEADPTMPLPGRANGSAASASASGSSRALASHRSTRSSRSGVAVADIVVPRRSTASAPLAVELALPDGFRPADEVDIVDVLDKGNPATAEGRGVEPEPKVVPLMAPRTMPPPPSSGWRWRPAAVEATGPDDALWVRFIDAAQLPRGAGYAEAAVIAVGDEPDSMAEHETKSAPQIAHHAFTVGDVLDVQDVFAARRGKGLRRKWRKCQIVRTAGPYWIRVTFVGWSRLFDEWFHVLEQADRLAEFGSQTEKDLARQEGLDGVFAKNLQQDRQLTVFTVEPDGNCLFNAVAHQVYGDVARHDIVRADCCDYLEKNRERFQVLLETGQFDEYVENKRKLKVWGDDPEVRAMEELYDRPVEVYVAQGVGTNTEPLKLHFDGDLPDDEELGEYTPIRLSFHGKNHYNSVIPFVTRRDVDERGKDIVKDISADVWKPPPLRTEGVIRRHRRAQMAERRGSAAPGFAVASNDLEDANEEEDGDEAKAPN